MKQNSDIQSKSGFKSGYVGVVGRPNVGKSTLINNFLRWKLSIISPNTQTTRYKILGILRGDNYEVIFYDTPGVMEKTKYQMHKLMVKEALSVIPISDLVLFMVEPTEPQEGDLKILEVIKKENKPTLLVINKIDTVKKENLLPLIETWSKLYDFKEIVPISALKLDGTDLLLELIIKYLPEREPQYPEDIISNQPERFFVAEMIREKIFWFYGEELPYSSAVEIEEFREEKDRVYIRAIIWVEKDSQKAMIIGKGGQAIKKVGITARKDIENFLGKHVYLDLWVKTKKGWRKDLAFLKRLGFEK